MNAWNHRAFPHDRANTGRSARQKPIFRASAPRSLALLWDRVASVDPGHLRLLLASRGALSVGLTVAAVIGLAYATQRPITQFAFGVVLSMVGPFVMRDPTGSQRQVTLLMLLPPAILAAVVASLASLHPPAGEVWLLLLIFVAALLQGHHPRALGMGLIAVVMTYIGLYLHLPPDTLPIQIASLGLAAAVVWIACFLLLPLRPVATLKLTVRSVRRRAGRVLREAVGARDSQDSVALRRHLAHLNAAALAAEDQLALLDEPVRTDLRLNLFELERAVTSLIHLLSVDAISERHWDRVSVTAERLRRGRTARIASRPTGPDGPREALLAVAHASANLERAASRAVALVAAPAAPPAVAASLLAWRSALQVTLASLVAMMGGMALSPQRWFWAVIAAYVVFLNTRSRGDALHKGAHRMLGTLAGLFGGLLISAAIADDVVIKCVVMLAAVFGIYYFYSISYSLAIFCVTVLLGMVYGSMHQPLASLLVLRLEETAIGVLAAGLAASFVWPIRTNHHVRVSGSAVLRSLLEVVEESLATIGGGSTDAPIAAVRKLDRQIVVLRLALAPLNAGRFLMGRARAERPLTALLACAEKARLLAGLSREAATLDGPVLRALGDHVKARIAAMLSGALHAEDENLPSRDEPAADALWRLDQALAMLSERLADDALDGFAVE